MIPTPSPPRRPRRLTPRKQRQKRKRPPASVTPAGVHCSCGGCTQRSSVEPRRLDAQPSRTVTIRHWITSFRKRLPAVAAEYGRRRRTLSPEPSPGAHRPKRSRAPVVAVLAGPPDSFLQAGGRQAGREEAITIITFFGQKSIPVALFHTHKLPIFLHPPKRGTFPAPHPANPLILPSPSRALTASHLAPPQSTECPLVMQKEKRPRIHRTGEDPNCPGVPTPAERVSLSPRSPRAARRDPCCSSTSHD